MTEPLSLIHTSFLSAPDAGLERTLELAATLYLPAARHARPSPGLVVGHGAGSRRKRHDEFCREAFRQGFIVLAIDFRGHGDSSGCGDGPLEQDILAAVDLLRGRPEVDAQSWCYRGSSLGGFYGLKAAPQAGLAAMALLCPAGEDVILEALDKMDKNGRTELDGDPPNSPGETPPRWDKAGLRCYFRNQDSARLASQVKCPVLLVHSRGDDVVPLAHSLLLAGHLRTETTLLALEGGTHTTAQHDPRIHQYTAAWLLERAGGRRLSACTECT